MKRCTYYTFNDYCTYREDAARDIGARVFGGNATTSQGEAVEPLVDLIREIWTIDREGVLNFFNRYRDDARADGTRISELIDELEGGKNKVSSLFKKSGREPDQIVPPESDMDGGDGGGDM